MPVTQRFRRLLIARRNLKPQIVEARSHGWIGEGLDNRGGVLQVEPIDDPKFYQDFFSRMDKSVYLQQEQL